MATRNSMGLACSVLVAAVACPALAAPERPEVYPSRPVRVIVQSAGGTAPDTVARSLMQRVSAALAQPFVIDTRAGAAGMVAAQMTIAAPPDGYTLLVGASGALTIAPFLGSKRPYDPLTDLAPVTMAAMQPLFIAAHPSLSVGSVKELVALARSKPNEIRFGSHGTGSVQHLTMELFARDAGITLAHIPYKGGAPAVTAAVSRETHLVVSGLASVLPHFRSSRLRAIAVTTARRSAAAPEIPTVAESGVPRFDIVTWYGIFAPGKTPARLVEKLHREARAAADAPEVKRQLATVALEVAVDGPQALAATVRADASKWQRLIRERGISLD